MIRNLAITAAAAMLFSSLQVAAFDDARDSFLVAPTPQPDARHTELTQFLLSDVDDPVQFKGGRVAIIARDGVDAFELEIPKQYLEERGATVHLISQRPALSQPLTASHAIRPTLSMRTIKPSGEADGVLVDRFLDQVSVEQYDAIILPGNYSEDAMFDEVNVIAFVQLATQFKKPVFAVGNGVLWLQKAGLLADRSVLAVDQKRVALRPGGARLDTDVSIVDNGNVITGRDAFDIPELMAKLAHRLDALRLLGRLD